MLDSRRGKGALASLDSLPRTFAGMNEVVKSNALMLVLGQNHKRMHHQTCIMDASESVVAPATDREREAGEGRPAG